MSKPSYLAGMSALDPGRRDPAQAGLAADFVPGEPVPFSTAADPADAQEPPTRGPRRRRRRWVRLGVFLLVVVLIGAALRIAIPWMVRDYVQRTLDRSPLYTGRIGQVRMHLWRGAYSIQDVRISKRTGSVPVPLFSGKEVDFSIQWNALLHGRIVGRVRLDQPELNFVDSRNDSEDQTGAGGPWLDMIRDLFPFKINRAVVSNGSIHFRVYQADEPVDVYLSEVHATVDDLGNIRDETTPLVATVQATALAMNQANLSLKMTLDPYSYRPTFHMALRLLGLDVTRLNRLAKTYGGLDFQHGWFDFVLEVDAKEGVLTGYAKPLFRELQVFSVTEDIRNSNPLEFFWQALVGAATSLFKNQPRDQFGTLIPFTGDLSGATTADILATLGNVFRNAFVRAYLPALEPGRAGVGTLQFGPPQPLEDLSIGGLPAE